MFVCSLCVFPGVLAPWITERSMSTMELKVLLDSKYYYYSVFIVICVCFLRLSSPVMAETRVRLRILVAEMSCLFFGCRQEQQLPFRLGSSHMRCSSVGSLWKYFRHARKHAGWITCPSKCGNASESPQEHPGGALRMWSGSWKCSLLLLWPG